MRLRRFEGGTVAEALAKVRAELGPEAVILHTRATETGAPRHVEVTAAVDGTPAGAPPASLERPWPAKRASRLEMPPGEDEDRLDEIYQLLVELREGADCGMQGDPAVRALQRQELPVRVIRRLVPAGSGAQRGTKINRAALHRALVRAFRVRGPLVGGRRQRVITLVGPTGVGKTTTLAKLAGQLRHAGTTLSLISVDTYRIGALAQMQIYAELLGVPFQVARSAADLTAAVAAARDADVVLVDTTGRSPSHREGIAAVQRVLAAVPQREVHLAVSATTKAGDIAEILRRFRPLAYEYLVITKLDEARTAGPVLGAALDRALPISYLTAGQEVPSDLEPATPRALADLLLPDGARGRGEGRQ